VAIEVADDGPGLPAVLGERIFEPFVTTKETGPGLGLSICRRIAEAHGGSIVAADRPGGGASFVVRLPLDGAGRPLARP
jgi:signal transduction histidine kinase